MERAVLLSDIEFLDGVHESDWERIEEDSFLVNVSTPLNENQQIVLEWLKEELNDSYFKSAVSNLFFWVRYDDVEGFPNERSHKMVQAFEELNDKDFGQVLAAFSEWGKEEVAE